MYDYFDIIYDVCSIVHSVFYKAFNETDMQS